jgi:methylmalonyl-CoA mutase
VPVLGITGTGGAGKSSLTDELLSRLLRDHPDRHIAVSQSTRAAAHRRGAARRSHPHERAARPAGVHAQPGDPAVRVELSRATDDVVRLIKLAGYGLVIVETSGIGQGDAEITRLADLCCM